MPASVLGEWMRRVRHPRYTNLYGPTETTIASSYFDVDAIPDEETDSVSIGVACRGEELLLLDERRRPVSPGEIGQIFIAGVGLSPGYWRDDEKTREVFVKDAQGSRIYATGDLGRREENGVFRFVGRVDSQVKHRGYRIELGEIEGALNGISQLRECAVTAVASTGFEGTTICCAYVPDTADVTPVRLRAALSSSLPSYMLPSRWQAFDALPKNANGKIDRRSLREQFEAEPANAGGA
jgi:acyl-coenzyme A synthetase/AMP-(fatty) acid ligase